jgi:hypothetical protein
MDHGRGDAVLDPLHRPDPPPAAGALRWLAERARGGDAAGLAALRQALDEAPEVWRHCGDLAAHAERAWVDLACGSDPLMRESLARTLAELKAELAGPAPTPLERLLVARAAACWLQASYCDAAAAQARDVSTRQAELASKRQDRAHRRYLAAVAALASVRRLLPAAAGPAGTVVETRPAGSTDNEVDTGEAGAATTCPERGADPPLAVFGATPQPRPTIPDAGRPRRARRRPAP